MSPLNRKFLVAPSWEWDIRTGRGMRKSGKGIKVGKIFEKLLPFGPQLCVGAESLSDPAVIL